MRFVEYSEQGQFRWQEGRPPTLSSALGALVSPGVVASCDLDAAVVDGRAPLPGPYAFGHEFVGTVTEVGAGVTSLAVGDLVSVPFQISCGTCTRCRAGLTGNCTAVPARASYGLGLLGGLEWGGALADLVEVPFADAMAVRVPAGVDPHAVASLSDNLPDAYRAVAPWVGEGTDTLVIGGGSIGLYAVAIARALGADVRYVDVDEARVATAEGLGARVEQRELDQPVPRAAHVVHTSGDPAQLWNALRSTDHGASCVDTGIYFGGSVSVPMLDMYGTGVNLVTGRAHARRDMPHVLDLVVSGRLDPSVVTSRVVSWQDAPEALAEPATKLVVSRIASSLTGGLA